MKRKTRLLIIATIICLLIPSNICYARKLKNMTTSELNDLKSQIEEELDTNHYASSEEQSKIDDLLKGYVEDKYGEDNVSWAWIDYEYTKEWDFITEKTHADIEINEKSERCDIYGEIYDTGNDYQLIYVKIGDNELVNNRDAVITDKKVRKMLGLSESASNSSSTDESEQSDESSQQTSEDSPLAVNGDKSDTVKEIQEMLIRLEFLSGSADGSFGGMTEEAVKKYQESKGLNPDGIVTQSLYDAMKADYAVAPEPIEYQALNYNDIQRNPDSYKDTPCKFSGTVIQVSEGWFGSVTLRIGQDGSYDNIWYVTYSYSDGESKILEDDYVTVYGTCEGTETYTTIMGASVTIPACDAEKIELR